MLIHESEYENSIKGHDIIVRGIPYMFLMTSSNLQTPVQLKVLKLVKKWYFVHSSFV